MKRLLGIALVLTAVLAVPAHAEDAVFVKTPNGNISCSLFKGSKGSGGLVRCDIGKHSWTAPPKPADCAYDYGTGATVGVHGRAEYNCVSDSSLGVGDVLKPGRSVTEGRFSCKVLKSSRAGPDGVRCVNGRSRHGFTLSKAKIRLF